MLEALLKRLNRAIDEHNRELDQAVEEGDLEPERADMLRVAPGSATVEMVRMDRLPQRFLNAVHGALTDEHPEEICRLVGGMNKPSKLAKAIAKGAANAKGKRNVLVRVVDLAHIYALAQG